MAKRAPAKPTNEAPGWWGVPARMITVGASHFGEVGRWVLDTRGFHYLEERHAPLLHILATRRNGGALDVPVVVLGDTTLTNARELLEHLEQLVPLRDRLMPLDHAERAEAEALIGDFYDRLGPAVRLWAYSHMLPERRLTAPVMTAGVPRWERFVVLLAYRPVAAGMQRGLGINPQSTEKALLEIRRAFETVDDRLADGRRYLVGDRFSAADLVFAALSAPVLGPEEYGGALPPLSSLPPAMKKVVNELRACAAGSFALRMYVEHRRPLAEPEALERPGFWKRFKARAAGLLLGPETLRAVFSLLRRFRPVASFGGRVLVARHADVIDVLSRDTQFTIREVNNERMVRLRAPFFLGWDRSPEYVREVTILRQAVRREDLPVIRNMVREHAERLIAAARPLGRINFPGSLARRVATRVVAEYFGTPGPSEDVMMRWMRVIFHELFFNRNDDPTVRASAMRCGEQLERYLFELIEERRREAGNRDDVFGRLLAMQGGGGDAFDDDGIRRNISGLIAGAVDTTAHAATHALDQLLRRPDALSAAIGAARDHDIDTLTATVFEALRFDPQTPALLRYCGKPATVAAGQPHERVVPADTEVVLLTLSAMFDPTAFPEPHAFRLDRDPGSYLHFGHAMHECFGRYINAVQIPEIVGAALSLPNVRRAPGSEGRITYDGPFPDRLVLEFDS